MTTMVAFKPLAWSLSKLSGLNQRLGTQANKYKEKGKPLERA